MTYTDEIGGEERTRNEEREEREHDIQREMKGRRWIKENKFELKLEREGIHLQKLKVEMGVKLKSWYVKYHWYCKLPKIELKKFDSNVLAWQEFWDAFNSTIHQNEILQRPDKFTYLRSQLVGWANESIARLDLTNDNYDVAIKLLKEQYV